MSPLVLITLARRATRPRRRTLNPSFVPFVAVPAGVCLALVDGVARAQTIDFDTDGAVISSDIGADNAVRVGFNNANPFTVTVADGGKITKRTDVYNKATFQVAGGSVGNVFAFGNSRVNLMGGTTNYVNSSGGSQVTVTGGVNNEIVTTNLGFGAGSATILGGSNRFVTALSGQIEVNGGSAFRLSALADGKMTVEGGAAGGASADIGGTLTVNGGRVNGIVAFQDARVTVNGGTHGGVSTWRNSVGVVNGGYFPGGGLDASETSTLTVNGGSGTFITSSQHSGTLTMNAGFTSLARSWDTSTFNLHGGQVTTFFQALNQSTLNVYGGYIEELFVLDDAVVNYYGGKIGRNSMLLLGSSSLRMYGTNWDLTDPTAGTYLDDDGVLHTGTYYTLSGTFEDGTPVLTSFFDEDGGNTIQLLTPGAVVSAPEPGSAALLCLSLAGVAGSALRKRRPCRAR